jgi:hypothetical protein
MTPFQNSPSQLTPPICHKDLASADKWIQGLNMEVTSSNTSLIKQLTNQRMGSRMDKPLPLLCHSRIRGSPLFRVGWKRMHISHFCGALSCCATSCYEDDTIKHDSMGREISEDMGETNQKANQPMLHLLTGTNKLF